MLLFNYSEDGDQISVNAEDIVIYQSSSIEWHDDGSDFDVVPGYLVYRHGDNNFHIISVYGRGPDIPDVSGLTRVEGSPSAPYFGFWLQRDYMREFVRHGYNS